MRAKKVILDTNLWISFLISNKLNLLDKYIFNGEIKLVFSTELIEEFVNVAQRPIFEKYFNKSDIENILDLFENYGKLVKVKTQVNICRDLKDNFLLNLAIDSKAHFLVTGDSDLLILEEIKRTKILSWTDLLKELK